MFLDMFLELFFLEHTEELRIFILRRKAGEKNPNTARHQGYIRTHPRTKEKRPTTQTLDPWRSNGLQEGEALCSGHRPQQGLIPGH
jgi:hypothetical protein